MMIFLDILKFFVVLVYLFFIFDSLLSTKYDSDEGKLFWFDFVYLAYAGVNFVLIVKVLHG